MRRIVDRLTRDRRADHGRATARGLALAALIATGAVAGDGDGPALPPASEAPLISKPSNPAPQPAPPRPATSATRSRAMLAIPGLTTPSARPSIPLEGPKPVSEPGTGELSLDAPIEMRPLPEALPSHPGANPARSSLPLVLDSSPMDEPSPLESATTRTNPPSRKSPKPPQPVPTPARRPRLFGFLAGPARSTSTTPPASKSTTPGRSVAADDLRDDSSADSALKRRIERQAREAVGNRARSVEVKVEGKEAVVQVSGVKFYQKRAVRKQLESLPALAGLRSTIEVDD